MKEINVTGKKRSDLGKKASKALRKQGFVPCNLYGEKRDEKGIPVALAFAASLSELRKLVYTPHTYVVNLDIDGEKHGAILKELQFDPVTDGLLHVDFFEINEAKPIVIAIPVKIEGLAPGVRDGGRMNIGVRKLNVKAPFQLIPEHLVVNVSELRLGKSIKVGELSYDNIEIVTNKEVVVCSVKMTRQAVDTTTEEAPAADADAAAATAAATPAADADAKK
jgi:large subunit ribosomal protein L25